MVKNLPANSGDMVLIPGLGWSPEKEMAVHSSILAWEIPWTEESGGLQSLGLQKSWTRLSDYTTTTYCHMSLGIFTDKEPLVKYRGFFVWTILWRHYNVFPSNLLNAIRSRRQCNNWVVPKVFVSRWKYYSFHNFEVYHFICIQNSSQLLFFTSPLGS